MNYCPNCGHHLRDYNGNDKKDQAKMDLLYRDAIQTVFDAGKASTSLLQLRLRIGYAKAEQLIRRLEEEGYIGPAEGSDPRKVLFTAEDIQ
jgi:S-DNA-T family DNA segregation ATPase FtsK/SpoIIIE